MKLLTPCILEASLLGASTIYAFVVRPDARLLTAAVGAVLAVLACVIPVNETGWNSARWIQPLNAKPRGSMSDKGGLAVAVLLPILVAKSHNDVALVERAVAGAMWTVCLVCTRSMIARNVFAAFASRVFVIAVLSNHRGNFLQLILSGLPSAFLLLSLRRWSGCLSLGEATLLTHATSEILLVAHSMLDGQYEKHLILSVGGLLLAILPALVISPPQASRLHLLGRLTAIIVLVIYPWAYISLGHKEPIMIMLLFCLGSLRTCLFWLLCLFILVFVVPPQKFKGPEIIARKGYHIAAVVMFTPVIFLDLLFLQVAMSWAFAILLLFELIRQSGAWTMPEGLNMYMESLLDDRDSGVLVLTHLYLLGGCAFPVVVGRTASTSILGVSVLGLGDTLASVVGSQYGRVHWPGSRKTVEGTAGAWFGTVTFQVGAALLEQGWGDAALPRNLAVALAVSLLESFTCQIDNLVLSPYFYALTLLSR